MVQQNLLWWWRRPVSVLSSPVGTSHVELVWLRSWVFYFINWHWSGHHVSSGYCVGQGSSRDIMPCIYKDKISPTTWHFFPLTLWVKVVQCPLKVKYLLSFPGSLISCPSMTLQGSHYNCLLEESVATSTCLVKTGGKASTTNTRPREHLCSRGQTGRRRHRPARRSSTFGQSEHTSVHTHSPGSKTRQLSVWQGQEVKRVKKKKEEYGWNR